MTPQVATGFVTSTSRAFVDQLVRNQVIKDGFQSVLGSKDIVEIEQYLLANKLVSQDQFNREVASFFGLEYIDLLNRAVPPAALSIIPLDIANKYQIVAYDLQGLDLYLAVGQPATLQSGAPKAIAGIRQEKGFRLHLAVAPESEVRALIGKIQVPAAASTQTETDPDVTMLPVPPPTVETEPVKSLNKQDLIAEVEPRSKEVDLRTLQIAPETLHKIPYDVAKKYQIIVFESAQPATDLEPPLIKVAVVDGADPHVKEILSYIQQRNKVLLEQYQTSKESFEAGLQLYNQSKVEPSTAATEQSATVPPPPPDEKPAAQPIQSHEQTSSIAAPKEGLVLKEGDITLPASENGGDDLSRLALQQQRSLDDQNLDRLLKKKIESPEELAQVYKGGIVPEIVAATLFLGIRMRASDVHIEAERDSVRIRFRIDGILHDILSVPKFLHAPLISRIKILSKMKIDEQRVPQDGRFDVILDSRQVDLRVSTMPTVHGEKIVMRLLDKSEGIKSLEQLGVTGSNFDLLLKNIEKPFGVILSTGPTGSGKSTTLYAILSRISKPGVNIVTLEDPVEYELTGVNQAQVKPQIGFTFAEGLRSVLRQDPNVIMVGEIRDLETAGMATQAALTGHLVLSTLHTNDASGALPRLIDMGVEPFLITSSINCVVGQRLVRRICEDCKEKIEIPVAVKAFIKKELSTMAAAQLQNVDMEQLVFYHGRGCPNCTNGYRGRIGIFEVLPMSDAIEELAVRKAPSSELKKQAIADGMVTMVQDGLIKALKGITTVDEVMRVTTTSFTDLPDVSED